MNSADKPISEDDLHAYADGQLEGNDLRRLERWLAENPADAQRVREWQRQNAELRDMFDGYAKSLPGDADLIVRTPQRQTPPQRETFVKRMMAIAAALLIFASGIGLGRMAATPDVSGFPPMAEMLPHQSKSAYLIYASDVRHPVEVEADQHEHLVNWLGKRLGFPLSTPDLGNVGFQLIGGRLVPVNGEPGAMFMYEDGSGRRVSILIGRNSENRTTSFRVASDGGLETFYWIDGPLGYAITGEISRSKLQAIANECYRQFQG